MFRAQFHGLESHGLQGLDDGFHVPILEEVVGDGSEVKTALGGGRLRLDGERAGARSRGRGAQKTASVEGVHMYTKYCQCVPPAAAYCLYMSAS
jgi:hypothetical protein